jgi:putative Ca2+/H+ antiporter (TMEM165/GDT1 family)
VTAFLVSFGVIFVAELGDKSQLMALAFATRFPFVPVLIGITAATATVHAVSVLIGAALGAAIPTRPITIVAAIAFVAFGLWTLRGDELTDEDEAKAARSSRRNTILTVGGVFFLAELGDKTMLATITLATNHGLLGTWLGSTVGMVVADALAIVVGRQLGARLPERAIKIGAAIAFFAFAAYLLFEAL